MEVRQRKSEQGLEDGIEVARVPEVGEGKGRGGRGRRRR